MTAAERLRTLAGTGGVAAALLLLIGSGSTAGEALVNYSGLPTGTAAEHLLTERRAVLLRGPAVSVRNVGVTHTVRQYIIQQCIQYKDPVHSTRGVQYKDLVHSVRGIQR